MDMIDKKTAETAKRIRGEIREERTTIKDSLEQFKSFAETDPELEKSYWDMVDFHNSLMKKAKVISEAYEDKEVKAFVKAGSGAFIRNRNRYEFWDKLRDQLNKSQLEKVLATLKMDEEIFKERFASDPIGFLNAIDDRLDNRHTYLMNHIGDMITPTKLEGERITKQYPELATEELINMIGVKFRAVRDLGIEDTPEVDSLLNTEDTIDDFAKSLQELAENGDARAYVFRLGMLADADAHKQIMEERKQAKKDILTDKDKVTNNKILIASQEDVIRDNNAIIESQEKALTTLNAEKQTLIAQITNAQEILREYASKHPAGTAPAGNSADSPTPESGKTPKTQENPDDEEEGENSTGPAQSGTPSKPAREGQKGPQTLKPREGYITHGGQYYSIAPNKFKRHICLDHKGHLKGTLSQSEYDAILRKKKEDDLMHG